MLTHLFLLTLPQWAMAHFAVPPIGALRHRQEQYGDDSPRRVLHETNYAPTQWPHNLKVPVDHFPDNARYEPHSNDFFDIRYFYDSQYYQPGGPVIVLESGETEAEDRIPYLEKGIIHILAKAMNGVGVVLEHRYYGSSFPVPDLTTENMRFLTTEQSMADVAYFAQNVVFPGLANYTLTAPETPWIVYGGSYAGAFAAFLRTTYPKVFWGAIGSSAVTEAIWDYWEYYEPIREHADPACVNKTALLTLTVDGILGRDGSDEPQRLKESFGLGDLVHNDDFANVISYGIGSWQSRNWDPEVNDLDFDYYCGNITSTVNLYPEVDNTVVTRLLEPGYDEADPAAVIAMTNYMGYIATRVAKIAVQAGEVIASYYSNRDASKYAETSLAKGFWRSWPWQFCTEWGFLKTGSGALEAGTLPLISRLLTVEYVSTICRSAFNLTQPANTELVNRFGGFNISYERLAFVDGNADPWLRATPHSPHAPPRASTPDNPFILMEGAVHHWDENGLEIPIPGLPPTQVAQAQQALVDAVGLWLQTWRATAGRAVQVDTANSTAQKGPQVEPIHINQANPDDSDSAAVIIPTQVNSGVGSHAVGNGPGVNQHGPNPNHNDGTVVVLPDPSMTGKRSIGLRRREGRKTSRRRWFGGEEWSFWRQRLGWR